MEGDWMHGAAAQMLAAVSHSFWLPSYLPAHSMSRLVLGANPIVKSHCLFYSKETKQEPNQKGAEIGRAELPGVGVICGKTTVNTAVSCSLCKQEEAAQASPCCSAFAHATGRVEGQVHQHRWHCLPKGGSERKASAGLCSQETQVGSRG